MDLTSLGHKLACEILRGVEGVWRQESAWRVLRGGSWNNNNRDNLLSSYRNNNDPENRNDNNGFRVVCVAGSGG